ncbi:MAG TPA: sigma-70 family RNA polymerase sigma factor [Bryobacteraceae bacterium]|nr:sigma-70 family RNA polymerase sigma factor [Bryobacteraceae bacterium]
MVRLLHTPATEHSQSGPPAPVRGACGPAGAIEGLNRMMREAARPPLESSPDESQQRRDRFVQEHMRRIFLQIYRMVGNIDDAQDLTQEAFIKALQREDQLKDLDKAAHWLSRIASNTAIDFLRRHGRISFCELDDAPEPRSTPPYESPEDILLRSEQRAYLDHGLRLLSGRERTALLLRDVEGLPAEEVARQLNCSKATVRSHIANARIKFRRYIERRKP